MPQEITLKLAEKDENNNNLLVVLVSDDNISHSSEMTEMIKNNYPTSSNNNNNNFEGNDPHHHPSRKILNTTTTSNLEPTKWIKVSLKKTVDDDTATPLPSIDSSKICHDDLFSSFPKPIPTSERVFQSIKSHDDDEKEEDSFGKKKKTKSCGHHNLSDSSSLSTTKSLKLPSGRSTSGRLEGNEHSIEFNNYNFVHPSRPPSPSPSKPMVLKSRKSCAYSRPFKTEGFSSQKMTSSLSSVSIQLEDVEIRPESVHKMLRLQKELFSEPDKYNNPDRYGAFDLIQLDYKDMERYIKYQVFHHLKRGEQKEKGRRRRRGRGGQCGRRKAQGDDENDDVSSNSTSEEKEEDQNLLLKNEEKDSTAYCCAFSVSSSSLSSSSSSPMEFISGRTYASTLCDRIMRVCFKSNWFFWNRHSSVAPVTLRQSKKEGRHQEQNQVIKGKEEEFMPMIPSKTATATSPTSTSTKTSTSSSTDVSSFNRRKELQYMIEGRTVTDSSSSCYTDTSAYTDTEDEEEAEKEKENSDRCCPKSSCNMTDTIVTKSNVLQTSPNEPPSSQNMSPHTTTTKATSQSQPFFITTLCHQPPPPASDSMSHDDDAVSTTASTTSTKTTVVAAAAAAVAVTPLSNLCREKREEELLDK